MTFDKFITQVVQDAHYVLPLLTPLAGFAAGRLFERGKDAFALALPIFIVGTADLLLCTFTPLKNTEVSDGWVIGGWVLYILFLLFSISPWGADLSDIKGKILKRGIFSKFRRPTRSDIRKEEEDRKTGDDKNNNEPKDPEDYL